MLVVRDSQRAALAAAAAEPFVHATARWVEQRWPDEHRRMGRAATCAAIREAVQRCSRYGFDDPAQVRTYVEVMFMLGDMDFDQNVPWARTVLGDRTLAGSLKALELEDGLARQLLSLAEEVLDEETARMDGPTPMHPLIP
jgi:hypothetical protein